MTVDTTGPDLDLFCGARGGGTGSHHDVALTPPAQSRTKANTGSPRLGHHRRSGQRLGMDAAAFGQMDAACPITNDIASGLPCALASELDIYPAKGGQ